MRMTDRFHKIPIHEILLIEFLKPHLVRASLWLDPRLSFGGLGKKGKNDYITLYFRTMDDTRDTRTTYWSWKQNHSGSHFLIGVLIYNKSYTSVEIGLGW